METSLKISFTPQVPTLIVVQLYCHLLVREKNFILMKRKESSTSNFILNLYLFRKSRGQGNSRSLKNAETNNKIGGDSTEFQAVLPPRHPQSYQASSTASGSTSPSAY